VAVYWSAFVISFLAYFFFLGAIKCNFANDKTTNNNIMKQIIKIILSCLFLVFSYDVCFAQNSGDGDNKLPLVITHTIGRPVTRTLDIIPMNAYYDTSTECVFTTFAQNIGTVTITLTNEATGETSTTTVDSSLGTSTIQISGTSGSWHVVYATSGGSTYEGDFEI